MDELTRELMRTSHHAKLSPSDLESMGKRASNMFLDGRESLTDAVVKLASENPGITAHQVQRVVEFANQATFHTMFEKQADKNVQFPLADPREVLRSMDISAQPAVRNVTLDYSSDPEKLAARDNAPHADLILCQAFGMEPQTEKMASAEVTADQASKYVRQGGRGMDKVAADLTDAVSLDAIKQAAATHEQYPQANPEGDLVRLRQDVTKVAEDLETAWTKNQALLKEATDALTYQVKQHLLSGGNLGEAVHAMGLVGADPHWTKEAMEVVIPALEPHGLDPVKTRADMAMYEMTKGASARVVNPDNPIIQSFAAMVKIAENQNVLSIAREMTAEKMAGINETMAKISGKAKALKKVPRKRVIDATRARTPEQREEVHHIADQLRMEREGLGMAQSGGKQLTKWTPKGIEVKK